MKISKMAIMLFLLSPAALAGNHWHVMLPGGNMRFQGKIIAEACSLALSDRQMTVDMGQLSSNRFHAAGEYGDSVGFDIHLQGCSTVVSQRVGISFYGVSDIHEPELLSVDEENDASDGIAIALFNESGELVKLNQPPENWVHLTRGDMKLHM
ncbi:S/F1C fimbrial minor subunit SfaD, partial [Escherichia coli]